MFNKKIYSKSSTANIRKLCSVITINKHRIIILFVFMFVNIYVFDLMRSGKSLRSCLCFATRPPKRQRRRVSCFAFIVSRFAFCSRRSWRFGQYLRCGRDCSHSDFVLHAHPAKCGIAHELLSFVFCLLSSKPNFLTKIRFLLQVQRIKI